MKKNLLWTAMAAGLLMATPALGQPEKKADKQPDKTTKSPEKPASKPADKGADKGAPGAKAGEPTMEEYMKASQPGDGQKRLEQFAGNWEVVIRQKMSPEAPWTESKGSEYGQMWYEGRYMHATFKGDMMGQEFKGLAIVAYNNATKQYESTWIDSMSTGIMVMKGDYNAATKTYTFNGEMPDPITGVVSKMREVVKMDSDTKHTSTFYETRKGGTENKMMELIYTRKAADDKSEGADKGKGEKDKSAKDKK